MERPDKFEVCPVDQSKKVSTCPTHRRSSIYVLNSVAGSCAGQRSLPRNRLVLFLLEDSCLPLVLLRHGATKDAYPLLEPRFPDPHPDEIWNRRCDQGRDPTPKPRSIKSYIILFPNTLSLAGGDICPEQLID